MSDTQGLRVGYVFVTNAVAVTTFSHKCHWMCTTLQRKHSVTLHLHYLIYPPTSLVWQLRLIQLAVLATGTAATTHHVLAIYSWLSLTTKILTGLIRSFCFCGHCAKRLVMCPCTPPLLTDVINAQYNIVEYMAYHNVAPVIIGLIETKPLLNMYIPRLWYNLIYVLLLS